MPTLTLSADIQMNQMVECDAKSISKRPLDPQKVCLLDMRGTQPLEPEDADIFTHFVLGGILGDDPPRYLQFCILFRPFQQHASGSTGVA